MKLYVKNMFSVRCKMAVVSELDKLKLKYSAVEIGEISLSGKLTNQQQGLLLESLHKLGLEVLEDKKARLVEKIITIIMEIIYSDEEFPAGNFSTLLGKKLNYEYNYLSNLFKEVKGMTIEHFIILHKVERIKDMIIYNELNLSEIAHKLDYSSSAHLSTQFKQLTGLTPSEFRSLKKRERILNR